MTKLTRMFLCLFLVSLSLLSNEVYAKAVKSTAPAPASYCTIPGLKMVPLNGRPVYSVKDYGAAGDGMTDDTSALQKAFDDTPSGAVLELPPGTYLHSKSLKLSKDGTIFTGKGGILKATNPDDQTIEVTGKKSSIIDVTFVGTGGKRSTKPQTTKIWVKGGWNQILNNKIEGGASGGIFIYGADDFRIMGNTVSGTLADGIHMTNGARRGLVEGNRVYRTGDDPIAVVSYQNRKSSVDNISGDIIIRNNVVSDVRHGRGITVVGGENVLIKGNSVASIAGAAGILVAQEKSYNTTRVANIIVTENSIRNIQTARGVRYTHQAAIDINSSGQRPVENIQVIGNVIEGSRFPGVRVLGHVCDVSIQNNKMSKIMDKNPVYAVKNPCTPDRIWCVGNMLGAALMKTDPAYCQSLPPQENPFPAYDFAALEKSMWPGCK